MVELAFLAWIGTKIDAPGWYFTLLGVVIVVRFLNAVANLIEKTINDKEES